MLITPDLISSAANDIVAEREEGLLQRFALVSGHLLKANDVGIFTADCFNDTSFAVAEAVDAVVDIAVAQVKGADFQFDCHSRVLL